MSEKIKPERGGEIIKDTKTECATFEIGRRRKTINRPDQTFVGGSISLL
jgi:hypothetical protein